MAYNLKSWDPNVVNRQGYNPVDNSQQEFERGSELRKRRADKLVSDAMKELGSDASQIDKYKKASEVMMPFDSDKAKQWSQMASQLESDSVVKEKSPDDIRYKLVSNLNSLNARMSGMESSDLALAPLQKLATSIQSEIAKDVPSMQRAYILLDQSNEAINDNADKPTNLESDNKDIIIPQGVTVQNKTAIRNNKKSDISTDWFKVEEEDGFNKPVLHEGLDYYNMPEQVKKRYDEALKKWNSNNDTTRQKSSEAGKMKKGEAIAKRMGSYAKETSKGLSSMATSLESLISKYNAGDYALANFKDLKSTMDDGRMTEGDVSIALGLDASSGIFQGILSRLSGGNISNTKLRDKETARTAINNAVNLYNKAIQKVSNPPFKGRYADYANQAYKDGEYSFYFGDLPNNFSVVGGGVEKNNIENKTEKPRVTSIGGWE